MLDDLKDMLLFILVILGLFIACLSPILGLAIGMSMYNCNKYQDATGRETKYEGFSCYGKIDGVWYSQDEFNKIVVPNRVSIE